MKRFLIVFILLSVARITFAAPPSATIEYQPMSSEGLAAGHPFESWVVFDKSTDPAVPGYALPADTTFRLTFPPFFTPQPDTHPEAVLLFGWPQKAAPIPFMIGLDPQDPRTVVLRLKEAFPAGLSDGPGLKAIHLRWGPLNPAQAGDYPITLQISNAGGLSGTTKLVAHIDPKPLPLVAAYNQLHKGLDEDWQHVGPGEKAAVPVDLLITLPDNARSFISLRPANGGSLEILGDETPIGTVTQSGVPVTLEPEHFGPGFARLGIARFNVTGGSIPGTTKIKAQLQGGTSYTITVIVGR